MSFTVDIDTGDPKAFAERMAERDVEGAAARNGLTNLEAVTMCCPGRPEVARPDMGRCFRGRLNAA